MTDRFVSCRTAPRPAVRRGGRGPAGFTLIELCVVMALVAIMIAFAIPNFEHLLTNETRRVSEWIMLQVPRLKAKAASEMKTYTLHVDFDDNRLWISNDTMTDDELARAEKKGLSLSGSVHLLDVVYPDGEVIDSGAALISFYPKGYSDQVILHLEEKNGHRRSFIIEPFLNQAEMKEGYVNFEG